MQLPEERCPAYSCTMQSLPQPTDISAQDCAWALLDAAPPMMWHIRRAMRGARKGLSMPQFRALVMISNEPDTSLSEVADHLALSLPTTSRIVTGLVKQGLLKRSDSAEDRRQLSLGITVRGQAVLNVSWAAAQESIAKELADFSPKQRATIVSAMRIVKQMFGALGLPAVPVCEGFPPRAKKPAARGRRVQAA
jgi:DNA-binding MarR family transcriptional regulator